MLALCKGNPSVSSWFPTRGQKFEVVIFLCFKPEELAMYPTHKEVRVFVLSFICHSSDARSITNLINLIYSLSQEICTRFVVLCFVVVMQSSIMNSHEVFIHIHQGCFAGTGAIVRLPQCQWSKPDGYGKISQCITTTKHSKAKTVCIFLGIYCITEQLPMYGSGPTLSRELTALGLCCRIDLKIPI